MGTISTRVPDDLEAELEEYLEAEHLDRSTAVRKLSQRASQSGAANKRSSVSPSAR